MARLSESPFLAPLIDAFQDRWRPLQARLRPRVVALELGAEQLRLQPLDSRYEPQGSVIEVPLPQFISRDGKPMEVEALGDLIGDLLLEHGLTDTHLLVALPQAAAQWRVVTFPHERSLGDPLDSLRATDPPPDLGLPFMLANAQVDVQPLEGAGRGGAEPLLLAAARTDVIDDWIKVFDLAGVAVERFSPSQACQLVALEEQLEGETSQALVALLDPHPEGCRLVLVRDGVPEFERLVGRDRSLADEVERCLRFYRQYDPAAAQRPLRLLVTGTVDGLQELEERVRVRAELLDPAPFATPVLRGLAAQVLET